MTSTDTTPFTFDGHQVRTVTDDAGDPWFAAADVCAALDISNHRDAIARLAFDERHGVGTADAMGRHQMTTFISEAGVYRLVFTSRRPEAEAFRSWLAHDVVPAIRRTGTYTAPAAPVALPTPRELAVLLITEADRADAAEARVAELEPAARFAADYLDAAADMSVDDAAGRLQRAGVPTGPRLLWTQMHALGWVHRSREDGAWRASASATRAPWLVEWDTGATYVRRGHVVLAAPQVRVTPRGLRRLGEVLLLDALDETLAVSA